MKSITRRGLVSLVAFESLLWQTVSASGREALEEPSAHGLASPHQPRQQIAAKCGPGFGRCASGLCCSGSGYCGTGVPYCGGSQCQIDFSDGCYTNDRPRGESTEGIPRPHRGSVPYGTIIHACSTPGTIALTFDDGPYLYTRNLLDILDNFGVKATFFIAGNNRGKGGIDEDGSPWPSVLQSMFAAGHQIASHTWTHRNLNEVNRTVQRTEVIFNEMAFRNIFGWIPTYIRAPYLECSASSGCTDLLDSLGYHIIDTNIDTKDYENDDPDLIQNSRDRFTAGVSSDARSNGYIVLAHDVHYETVVNLAPYMIQRARSLGYRLVTVGECLGDPKENWYRQAPGGRGAGGTHEDATIVTSHVDPSNPTKPSGGGVPSGTMTTSYAKPTKTSIVSKDQRCGGDQGQTCRGSKFGDCCSFYGHCGSSPAYCGTGCDPDFGSCTPVEHGVLNTTNGLCGGKFKATCAHFGDKNCCSEFGYCGNSAFHCGNGCQRGFGKCDGGGGASH